jgi:sigma-B regulation protein RsbU (phosphoserine phosphatase)
MPASLMMMSLVARVQVLAEDVSDVAALMNRLNKSTCANCPANRFITFFFSVFDPATGELRWASAGHNPPIIVRGDGKAEMLEGGGPVLGILSMIKFDEHRTQLGHDDMLVIYSDGVTEATNPKEEEYGEDRLIELLRGNRGKPASAIVDAVKADVATWAAGSPPADDVTLVVLKRA